MKQFEKDVLKRTNELNILNWSVLILTFWLAISILLCLNIRYKEHSCIFSLTGKCYPANLHCKNKKDNGLDSFDGIETVARSEEVLTIDPKSECQDEVLTITYPSAASDGTSTIKVSLDFTINSLPATATLYTSNGYTVTQGVGYEPITTGTGVSVYLNYFSGVSPWSGTSSKYLSTIQNVIIEGMSTQIPNRVITNNNPFPYFNTPITSGLLVKPDDDKNDNIDIISFKSSDISTNNPLKTLKITSNLNSGLFGNLTKIKHLNLQSLTNDNTGFDPYYNLFITNRNLGKAGCRNINNATDMDGKCPCIDPSVNVLPLSKNYPNFHSNINRYCPHNVTPTKPGDSRCVPYVDFSNQLNSGSGSGSAIKPIMPNPVGNSVLTDPDKDPTGFSTLNQYYFGPGIGSGTNKNQISRFRPYIGSKFQSFNFEPTKNFCGTAPSNTTVTIPNTRKLYDRTDAPVNSKTIAQRSLYPNTQLMKGGKISLGFPNSGVDDNQGIPPPPPS